MTPQQQEKALKQVQQQATQRVKLGQQLFEAADSRLKQQQDVLKDIQEQQAKLRDQVQADVAKSLLSYDQWMGQIDEGFTEAIQGLTSRIDDLELKVDASRGEIESMIDKAAALLNQTQELLVSAFDGVVAEEMKAAIPADPQVDIDSLGTPPIDVDAQDDDEVLNVQITGQIDEASASDAMPVDEAEGEDIFGEVLRRLRDGGGDGHAAA